MQRTSKIVDSFGRESRLRSSRIAEFERAGRGSWQGTGEDRAFVFYPCADAAVAKPQNSPTIGHVTTCTTERFRGSDSGFSMLQYPQPSRGGRGALSRIGAGL